MQNSYVIAYDFGTSSVKAVVISMTGKIQGSSTAAYPLYESGSGYVEQDPEEYWQAVIRSTRDVMLSGNIAPEQVKAIAFSTQSMGIIPVDKNGKVLHRNILWIDGRAEKQADYLNNLLSANLFGAKEVIPKLLWVMQEKPDIYKKTKCFLDVNGYIKYRATGVMTAEYSGASSYGLDLSQNTWLTDLFDLAGLDTAKLPRIVKSTDLVGTIIENAAAELGLSRGTPVFGGCDDVQAAALGSCCHHEGDAHIYLGSSAWLCVTSRKCVDGMEGVVTIKSADPSMNVVLGVMQAAGLTFNKAADLFYCHGLPADADIYALIDKEILSTPPGAENLLCMPWIYGEYSPIKSEKIRGAVFNISHIHTRAHIMRSVMEGIGYNLKWIIEKYRELNFNFDEITIIGGGAYSSAWMQILSDILSIKVKTVKNYRYCGAVGAAMCAVVGLGVYPDFNGADFFVQQDRQFDPNSSNRELYDKLFIGYKDFYKNNMESFHYLN